MKTGTNLIFKNFDDFAECPPFSYFAWYLFFFHWQKAILDLLIYAFIASVQNIALYFTSVKRSNKASINISKEMQINVHRE